ncbi:MAG: hypothetical protein IKQ97_02380, partial [Eubacterium sp.]|nr:hypothetical protein [Eubacterium sp.]
QDGGSAADLVLLTLNTWTIYAGCFLHPARRLNASMRWHRQVKATKQGEKQTSNMVRLFGVSSTRRAWEKKDGKQECKKP